jgi:histidinol-phosphatase (PHP family)
MKEGWETVDVDEIYREYYPSMIRLAESGLFSRVAHPDSLKCFHCVPKMDFSGLYHEVARALHRNNMAAEQSAGLRINYGHEELGMNPVLLDIFRQEGVELLTASDAHRPEDTGRFIKEMQEA